MENAASYVYRKPDRLSVVIDHLDHFNPSRIGQPIHDELLSLMLEWFSSPSVLLVSVLLLGGRIAASAALISPAEEMRAWLILAWVSTVAGNLSLLGSAANLIVCEQARRVQYFAYNLSFLGHLRFGVPSTLLVAGIGLFLVRSY